jgi:hypothetical protein
VERVSNGAFINCVGLTSFINEGDIKAGSLLLMDGYLWRVLEVRDSKALVISEIILEQRHFHSYSRVALEGDEISWADKGGGTLWWEEMRLLGRTATSVRILTTNFTIR